MMHNLVFAHPHHYQSTLAMLTPIRRQKNKDNAFMHCLYWWKIGGNGWKFLWTISHNSLFTVLPPSITTTCLSRPDSLLEILSSETSIRSDLVPSHTANQSVKVGDLCQTHIPNDSFRPHQITITKGNPVLSRITTIYISTSHCY